MRKVLVLILALSLMGALYAANPYVWTSGTVEGEASTEVFVDTTGTQKCVVGFSSTKPTSLTDTVTEISTDGVKLEVSTTDGTAATSKTFYLYYQIASGVDIDISMYGDDQLASTNNGNTDKVNWYVTVKADDSNSKSLSITGTSTTSGDNSGNGESNALLIHEHRPSPTTEETTDPWHSYNYGAYGGYAISINTGSDSLWDKRADKYSANLYVVISSDATGEAGA